MKKLIVALTIIFGLSVFGDAQPKQVAYAADLVYEVVIKDGPDKQRIIDGIKSIAPIPDNDEDGNPDFTDEEWVKEWHIKELYKDASRGFEKQEKEVIQKRDFSDSVEHRDPTVRLP